jgi:hypothetical protein
MSASLSPHVCRDYPLPLKRGKGVELGIGASGLLHSVIDQLHIAISLPAEQNGVGDDFMVRA